MRTPLGLLAARLQTYLQTFLILVVGSLKPTTRPEAGTLFTQLSASDPKFTRLFLHPPGLIYRSEPISNNVRQTRKPQHFKQDLDVKP